MEKEKKLLTCQECGKKDETVTVVYCGYNEELYGEKVYETICEQCENQHLADI